MIITGSFIAIAMLQEECKDLDLRIKNGLVKRLTIVSSSFVGQMVLLFIIIVKLGSLLQISI